LLNTNLIPMTGDLMNLRTLLEKTPDAGLLREMIDFADHRFMARFCRAGRARLSSALTQTGRFRLAMRSAGDRHHQT